MASINKLEAGMTVWKVTQQRAGNTMMRTDTLYSYHVLSVDRENKTVTASWNGNPARVYYERDYKTWKVKKPEMRETAMGFMRVVKKGK